MPIRLLSAALSVAALCAALPFNELGKGLPFSVGEKLVYDITVDRGHKVGSAAMWIEGPVAVRGVSTYLLRFDSKVRVALMSGASSSSSWFDPVARVSLRYYRKERSPVTRGEESVEMFPERRAWSSADGKSGTSPEAQPLDELSFIYFIRTLPLVVGGPVTYDRHFDALRDPVSIQMVRSEVVPTAMGEIKTMLVEMRVHDPKHFKAEGVIRINVSSDSCRLPVRIESTMPVLGKAVLTMTSHNALAGCQAR